MNIVDPNGIYTTNETRKVLRLSNSTIKRLLKKGIIRANKIGGQYRILGKEILRVVSPNMERKAVNLYQRIKRKSKKAIKNW